METLNILKPAVLKLWGGAPWWDINPLQEGCGRPREKYKVKLSFMAIIYACKIINFADAEKVCVCVASKWQEKKFENCCFKLTLYQIKATF